MKNTLLILFAVVFSAFSNTTFAGPTLLPPEEAEYEQAVRVLTQTVLDMERSLMETKLRSFRFLQSELEGLTFDGDKCNPVVRRQKISGGYLGCPNNLRLRNIYGGMEESLALRQREMDLKKKNFGTIAVPESVSRGMLLQGKPLPFIATAQTDKTGAAVSPPTEIPLPDMSKTDQEWENIRDHQDSFEAVRKHLISVLIEGEKTLIDLMHQHDIQRKKFESPGG